MPKLSLISHFYNSHELVKQQIEHWRSFPPTLKNDVEFIVIDDCSEQEVPIAATGLNLRYARIETDIRWNQAGARNLGTFLASAPWSLYFDIDQKLFPDPLLQILNHIENFDAATLYHLKVKGLIDSNTKTRLDFAVSTFLVNALNFKKMAGYDEDFAGHYGYEDLYMLKVWEKNGGKRTLLNDFDYFEDVGSKTANLDRALERNFTLAQSKIIDGLSNSVGMLRFRWKSLPT